VILTLLSLARPIAASEENALKFIDGMLGGIDARKIECSEEVRHQVETREMKAVCAKFDGQFELFRPRWDSYHQRQFGATQGLPGRDSPGIPQTEWLASGTRHERVYSLSKTVIGVRFQEGEVLVVYK